MTYQVKIENYAKKEGKVKNEENNRRIIDDSKRSQCNEENHFKHEEKWKTRHIVYATFSNKKPLKGVTVVVPYAQTPIVPYAIVTQVQPTRRPSKEEPLATQRKSQRLGKVKKKTFSNAQGKSK